MSKSSPTLVIMAGGSGTRFWPKSTAARPKQLLSVGGKTLLRQTLDRFDGVVAPGKSGEGARWIVTTSKLARAIAEDAPEARVLAEPQARNTAPCVYWAAREVAARDPEGVMLLMPADHHIARPDAFRETVRQAVEWARTHDDLVTLGIRPSRPETGYGYLQTAGGGAPGSAVKVTRFVEKPSLEKARAFLEDGNYLWNGGMFVWRASVILKAFDAAMPEMRRAWDACDGQIETCYPQMTATSIDFGVMEKAPNVVTFPLECGWDDLGSWTSLEDIADQLQARRPGGVVAGGELLAVESRGHVIDAPGRVVAVLGIDDLIVVEHGKALLVAPKARAQDIRLVVEAIKREHPELA